jgi:hypothetical protein
MFKKIYLSKWCLGHGPTNEWELVVRRQRRRHRVEEGAQGAQEGTGGDNQGRKPQVEEGEEAVWWFALIRG